MSTAMMSAPSSARRTAWLRPWPRAAPVTKATLPSTRPAIGFLRSSTVNPDVVQSLSFRPSPMSSSHDGARSRVAEHAAGARSKPLHGYPPIDFAFGQHPPRGGSNEYVARRKTRQLEVTAMTDRLRDTPVQFG